MTFEHKDVVVTTHEGMVVIGNVATALHLTREQAHWLQTTALPAALMQLDPSSYQDTDAAIDDPPA